MIWEKSRDLPGSEVISNTSTEDAGYGFSVQSEQSYGDLSDPPFLMRIAGTCEKYGILFWWWMSVSIEFLDDAGTVTA